MKLVKKSSDVFVATGPIVAIDPNDIAILKMAVADSTRGRVRINMHPDGSDLLHEMFIALQPNSYIRPHKHPSKSKSFHLIYGAVDIVVFEDDGQIREIVRLEAHHPEHAFYYRMSKPYFHTLLIKSDILIVHEITNGPFRAEDTLFASFAPEETDGPGIKSFLAQLEKQAAEHLPEASLT